jgi:Pyruvate/2-oxoacid:ferredoxin oxidoreductase delta subunit
MRQTTQTTQTIRVQHSVLVKWIVKGRSLMVENRVLHVANCQVVFCPEKLTELVKGDVVESVEFWYRYPVAGATLCIPDPKTGLLRPAQSTELSKVSNSHKQWVIQFTGKTARAIRRLYKQL